MAASADLWPTALAQATPAVSGSTRFALHRLFTWPDELSGKKSARHDACKSWARQRNAVVPGDTIARSPLATPTDERYQARGARSAPNQMSAEFAALVESHYAGLFRFALSLARDEASAADLTQQTFLKWARHGDQLRDRSKAKSWLFTTLHREFLALRRKVRDLADEAELDALPAPLVEPANQIDAKAAVAALAELDETYRAPVAMFYLEDLSYAEIAECLEIPIGTVMSRLSRGRERLRKVLSRDSIKHDPA